MSTTLQIEVFTYDELSPKAQEKARAWLREADAGDNYFAESVIEDAARMAGILGIDLDNRRVPLHGGGFRDEPTIWWSLGYSQSDGAWIEAHYTYAKGAARKIREEAPEDTTLHDIADRLQALQKPYNYQLTARIKDDERRPMTLDVDHPSKEIAEDAYKALREIVRDFQRWIYDQLRTEHEYQDSDEQIAENIRANDYTFRANGTRFDG